MKDTFINAIHDRRYLEVVFNSKEKGVITRTCIPFDYGPSRRIKEQSNRFHFYDLNSPDGKHTLSILPEQLMSIKALDQVFDPADYVTWAPIQWFIPRDWGIYS